MKRPFRFLTHIWVILFALQLSSCSDDSATIEFKIQGAEVAYVFRLEGTLPLPWDTVAIEDETLHLDLPVDSTLSTFYEIQFDNNSNRLRLGIEPGDEITGEIDARGMFLTYRLEGSYLSEQLCDQYRATLKSAQVIDSLDTYKSTHPVTTMEEFEVQERRNLQKLQDRYHAHKVEIASTIAEDPQSLANVFAFLNQSIGRVRIFSPEEKEDFLQMKEYAALILQAHPNHPLAKIFAMEMERLSPPSPQSTDHSTH